MPACRASRSTTSRSTSSPECWRLGFLCNLGVKPLAQRWFMSDEQVAALQPAPVCAAPRPRQPRLSRAGATLALAWLAVGIPIAWGVWVTLQSALALFG